jgi:hypothetical protein
MTHSDAKAGWAYGDGVANEKRYSGVKSSRRGQDRPRKTAAPINGFPPFSEILGEIGTTLHVLLAIAMAANLALAALGSHQPGAPAGDPKFALQSPTECAFSISCATAAGFHNGS